MYIYIHIYSYIFVCIYIIGKPQVEEYDDILESYFTNVEEEKTNPHEYVHKQAGTFMYVYK
jgi:hypothetical protein